MFYSMIQQRRLRPFNVILLLNRSTWKELSFVTTTNEYISTPGEILLEEFLKPLGISQYRLAQVIQKPQSAISEIIHGKRAITTEMAWLLSRALGTSPEFWLNLEMTYQIRTFDESTLPAIEAMC